MGVTTTIIPQQVSVDGKTITLIGGSISVVSNSIGIIGEIKQIDLSITGAETKSNLQSNGWAICDGTTPASQGISDAIITTTPDLRERFLRHSADETTGGTGGASTVTLDITQMPAHTHTLSYKQYPSGSAVYYVGGFNETGNSTTTSSTGGGLAHENKPPYYDICYFIKVK